MRMRITPCVAGCCGPMFTSRSCVWTSSMNSFSPLSSVRCSSGSVIVPRGAWDMACWLLAGDAVVLLGEHVVLAHRVTDPVVGQEDVARVGMTDEPDAEHLRTLALVPLRRAVDRGRARHRELSLGQQRLDREPM